MEIELNIQKKKVFYSSLIDFIDTEENVKIESLIQSFEIQEFLQNSEETISTFYLLSKIADNHYRSSNFFNKIGDIIRYIKKESQSQITDYEIYKIFKNNKCLLLLLLEQKTIIPDEQIKSDIIQSKDINNFPYVHYLYSSIKDFVKDDKIKQFERSIQITYGEELSTFVEKCREGENGSYICSLIRKDLIDDFITYITRTNFPINTQIKPTIYETNPLLMQNSPTLVEYAAFFGSMQIIRYLGQNNVPFTDSLWYYAAHSNNPEMIHFVEENFHHITKNSQEQDQNQLDDLHVTILSESIACHNNDFADYVKINFINGNEFECFQQQIVDSNNFYFYPSDIEYISQIISRPWKSYLFSVSQLCFNLKKITIPSSVTVIGDHAFYKCSLIKQIEIPSSVTKIRDNAFDGCSSLEQISIPSSISSFGSNVFADCKKLDMISILQCDDKRIDYFEDKFLLYKNNIESEKYETLLWCKTSLNTVTIPDFIEIIDPFAFYGCSSLTQVTIPSSVVSIKNCAFSGCTSLTQLIIKPSLSISFENNVFDGVESLEIIGEMTIIPSKLFQKCTSLKKIVIPSSVTIIESFAFAECTSLTQISIPSSVTEIGSNAFAKCSSLTQISIPSSVTEIGSNAFAECSSLAQISIPSSVTKIKSKTFMKCISLNKITIPSSVSEIGDNSFFGCSSLTIISLSSSITSIGKGAFYGCSSLKQLSIPPSVTKIDIYTFCKCSSLSQITIPKYVNEIGEGAFSECSSLEQIKIPSSMTSIGKCAFEKCSSLTQIAIPKLVTYIGEHAFRDCFALRQIIIPYIHQGNLKKYDCTPCAKVIIV